VKELTRTASRPNTARYSRCIQRCVGLGVLAMAAHDWHRLAVPEPSCNSGNICRLLYRLGSGFSVFTYDLV